MSYENIKAKVLSAFRESQSANDSPAPVDRFVSDAFVDDAIAHKKDLIDLLSKHPSWDAENLRVYVDSEFSRDRNDQNARYALNDIGFVLMKAKADDPKCDLFTLGHLLRTHDYDLSHTNIVPDGLTAAFREGFPPLPEARIKDQSKCTRSVMKMLQQYGYQDLPEDLKRIIDQKFAVYTDCMNELKVTKGVVLSVNPMDFLQMSWGNSWTSCHNIYEGGCYNQGCQSYALDGTTMILYTVPLGTGVDVLDQTERETRELFFWNGSLLVGSRCYPAVDDQSKPIYKENRAIVEQIISDCLELPNQWQKHPDWWSESHGNHYRDYECRHYDAYVNNFLADNIVEKIEIGHAGVCLACGCDLDEYNSDTGELFCHSCREDGNQCECCGSWMSENDSYWLDGSEVYVCYDCRYGEEVHECEYSGALFLERDMTYLEGVGWVGDQYTDNYVYSSNYDTHLLESDACYVERYDDYYPADECVWSNKEKGYILVDESVYIRDKRDYWYDEGEDEEFFWDEKANEYFSKEYYVPIIAKAISNFVTSVEAAVAAQ